MQFDTQKHIILEDERALLRPLQAKDFENFLSYSLIEPELWNYSLTPANGRENLKSYIELALEKRTSGDSYPFVVFDKLRQKIAGSTRFYDIQPKHQSLQLGYTWYGKSFQGTGLNKHCKFLMLKFAFETLSAHRVEFRADAQNQRSIAAMKSIGCTVEGILRSNCASPTGRRDSIVLSILANEWQEQLKQSLLEKLKKNS